MLTASRLNPADDLAGVPEGRKAELVDGELVLMPPTGDIPGESSLTVVISLREYGRRTGLGRAVPDNVGFLVDLPNRKSFSPGAAFHGRGRRVKFRGPAIGRRSEEGTGLGA